MERKTVYILWWALWAITALPIGALAIALGDVPMWASFDADATIEGVVIWAFFVAWIYLVPAVLFVTRHWWLRAKSSVESE